MEFHAAHGCYDLEKKVGNHFSVDLRIAAQAGDAPQRDELLGTINYVDVYKLVSREMSKPSNTLENVASRIVESLYNTYNQIVKVTVRVAKFAPPVEGKVGSFAVTITK